MTRRLTAEQAREIVIQHLKDQVAEQVEPVDAGRVDNFFGPEPPEDCWFFLIKSSGPPMVGASNYIAVSKKTGRISGLSSGE